MNTTCNISFKSNQKLASIPRINEAYTTPEMKANAITVWGGSRNSGSALNFLDLCRNTIKDLVLSGKNIISGNGADGIMGETYRTAAEFSKKDTSGKPIQNLTIITDPPYPDINLDNCITIGKGSSDSDRINLFHKTSDTFLVFPGRPTTTHEVTGLIQKSNYETPIKKLILIGADIWQNFAAHYESLFKSGDLDRPVPKLFTIANSKEEILKHIHLKA